MTYVIEPCAPDTADATLLRSELSAVLAAITGASGESSFDPRDERRSLFVVARNQAGEPIGCGAYRALSEAIAEVKRMYVRPGSQGAGAAILAFLEQRAAADGYAELWLETRAVNVRAIQFYERHGYSRIPNFGKYRGRAEAVCFAKAL